MKTKSVDLCWIVVSDIKKATHFFTETLGMRVTSEYEEYGWVELEGHGGGATIGLAAAGDSSPLPAGSNAVITLTVENIEQTVEELKKKNVELIGDLMEIPEHVKLQLIKDVDGNYLQLVQVLYK